MRKVRLRQEGICECGQGFMKYNKNHIYCVACAKRRANNQKMEWATKNSKKVKKTLRNYCRSVSGKKKRDEWKRKNRLRVLECEKIYRERNRGKINNYNKNWRKKNKISVVNSQKKWVRNNLDKVKFWRENNKDKIILYNKNYIKNNREKVRSFRRGWYHKNKDYCRKKARLYVRIRRKEDINFRIRERLKKRVYFILRNYHLNGNIPKSKKWRIDYKGIIEYLKPFPKNISDYHVDHIKPLCSFDFTNKNDIIEAFKPSNHQWLLAKDNLIKGGRW